MKTLIKALIGSSLLCFAGTALGVQVTIDPADYAGEWRVNYGAARTGAATVDLGSVDPATGSYVISLGGAELLFNVDSDGIVVVQQSAAATGGDHTLTFNTTTITVDPVYFAGDWRVVANATPDLTGLQPITLLPGLQFYALEVGATGGFTFHVEDDGSVTVPNPLAATGGPGTLTLENTERFLN